MSIDVHRVDLCIETGKFDLSKEVQATLEVEAHRLLVLVAQRPEARDLGALSLSVLLCDDSRIRPLNQAWRKTDRATDVLAFPLEEGGELGDVVISVETAARRCNPPDWLLIDELLFLLIHGLLHVLGHDHLLLDERKKMEASEQALWTGLGRTGTLRD